MCTELARRIKKLCGETSWFREEHDELQQSESQESQRHRRPQVRDIRREESILFIPLTQDSTLKKKLTELERNSTFRSKFKYVETSGVSLIWALGNLDPWKEHCSRENCFGCKTKPGDCMTQGVVYE